MRDAHEGADSSVAGLGTGESCSKSGRDKVPREHVQGRDWLSLLEGELVEGWSHGGGDLRPGFEG